MDRVRYISPTDEYPYGRYEAVVCENTESSRSQTLHRLRELFQITSQQNVGDENGKQSHEDGE